MSDTVIKRLQIAAEGGYTSASGSVYNGGSAVVATRRLAVANDVGFDFDRQWERQIEARGTYAGMYQSSPMMQQAKGKFGALAYADDILYFFKGIISGSPTAATLPTTPASLLTATAIAATMSLSSQPNTQADGALAKKLAVTLSNASSNTTAVTITIAGTGIYGQTLSEQISFSAGTNTPGAGNGGTGALTATLYTQNYFKTVTASGISTSAQPVGDMVAVGGVNGFVYTFLGDMGTSTLISYTGEYMDGTAAWQLPGMVITKFSDTVQFGKSHKVSVDVEALKKVALAGSTGSISPTAQAGDPAALQNLTDSIAPAIPAIVGRFYADPIGSTPGTTLISSRVTDYKIDVDMAVKLGKAADLTPFASYVGRAAYGDKIGVEFTALFNNYKGSTVDPVEVTQFLNAGSRVVRMALAGGTMPCGSLNTAGNWPAGLQDATGNGGLYGVMYDVTGKYTTLTEKSQDERAAFSFKLEPEVDLTTLNGIIQATLVSTVDPNH